MMHTVKAFNRACRNLERDGFTRTDAQWADIDETKFSVARALHPDGSYALYIKERQQQPA